MTPDSNKKYSWKQVGTGTIPHMLENTDDPNDKIWLCSCGGTKKTDGTCDGSHNKKAALNCNCPYCLPQDKRVIT